MKLRVHRTIFKHSQLFIGGVFLILLALSRNFSAKVMFELISISVIMYVALAYIHHHFDKTLTSDVIIEYILLGVLVLLIIQSFVL